MSKKTAYKLFEVTGIELEYMVVERGTLKVLPIVDKLFEDVTGKITSDVERGDVEWSNELVSHVVELKTAKPTKRIPSFRKKFASEVQAINAVLAKRNAMLLPTAAHPLMDPFTETVIWPHDHNEVYALYNGWKQLSQYNLQGEDNEIYATAEGMPAWFTLNVRAAYAATKNVSIQAGLENIMDSNYRTFASGISAPGRNFTISIRAQF